MLVGLGLDAATGRCCWPAAGSRDPASGRLARRHGQRALLGAVRRRAVSVPIPEFWCQAGHPRRSQPGQGDRGSGEARVLCVDGAGDGAGELSGSCSRARTRRHRRHRRRRSGLHLLHLGHDRARKGSAARPSRAARTHAVREMQHDFFPQRGDLIGHAANWAWLRRADGCLMPSWYLACRSSPFVLSVSNQSGLLDDGEHRCEHVAGADHAPVDEAGAGSARPLRPRLRTLISGGEAVGAEISEWTQKALKVRINGVFGQTECDIVLGHNGTLMPAEAGFARPANPRPRRHHRRRRRQRAAAGTRSAIIFKRPDPAMLLESWNDPQATRTSSSATGC